MSLFPTSRKALCVYKQKKKAKLAVVKLTWSTVVNVNLTVMSTVARLTFARVTPWAVHAAATVFAWILFAFINILTAAWSCISKNGDIQLQHSPSSTLRQFLWRHQQQV